MYCNRCYKYYETEKERCPVCGRKAVSKPRYKRETQLPDKYRELRDEPMPLSEFAKTQAEKDAEEI
jgi:DNA-directed RNA polymerase subunit RPC12/RpoP